MKQRKPYRTFSREFKLEAVRLMRETAAEVIRRVSGGPTFSGSCDDGAFEDSRQAADGRAALRLRGMTPESGNDSGWERFIF